MALAKTSFKNGNRSKGGIGSRGQIRRNLTAELVQQLGEIDPNDPQERPRLHRVVRNLIAQATTSADVYKTVGKGKKKTKVLVKEGAGDLAAITAIWDRLEGRPSQKIVGHDDGPVQVDHLNTLEELRLFLLERGIDSLRLPAAPVLIEDKRS
jgi:hypothetical protein